MNQKNKYIKDCKKLFPFYTKKEKAFLDKLASTIESSSDASYETLVEQYGSPKDIMLAYFQDCDDEYVIKQSSIKQVIKKVALCFISILGIGLTVISLLEIETVKSYKNREYITIEETIEEN